MTVYLVLWAFSAVGVVWATRCLDPHAPPRETWLLAAVPGVNSLLLVCALTLMFIQSCHRKTGTLEK